MKILLAVLAFAPASALRAQTLPASKLPALAPAAAPAIVPAKKPTRAQRVAAKMAVIATDIGVAPTAGAAPSGKDADMRAPEGGRASVKDADDGGSPSAAVSDDGAQGGPGGKDGDMRSERRDSVPPKS
jgi:hypothetical protein